MRLIFSKDRPAQLDLLLRSLRRCIPWHEPTEVIWWASDMLSIESPLVEGYEHVPVDHYWPTPPAEFDRTLRRTLLRCPDSEVTFFCDDDVVFDIVPYGNLPSRVLCSSLRLGHQNRQMELPPGFPQWDWTVLERHDFGFPGSIDGHKFRIEDVWEMIGDRVITDPTDLEDALAEGAERLAERRPLMICWPDQKLVGVPVNRVADRSGCNWGETFPQSIHDINDRFLRGERIDFDALDFSGVAGCHHEIEFKWRKL